MNFIEQSDQLSDDDQEAVSFGSFNSPVTQIKRGHLLPRSSAVQRQAPYRNTANDVWTMNKQYNTSRSYEDTSFSAQPTNDTSSSNIYNHNNSRKTILVSTAVLTDKAQSLFKFTYFNKMQSKCFHTMYEQDHNCVISSPTGSGKTVLFELAILRLMNTHTTINNIKILYIAPTKALCVEREKDWQSKFSTFGLNVGTLTSDTGYIESEKVKRCNIIITTPEKWDLMTRKWSDYTKLFGMIRLLLIDEIHILREDRGSTLEVVTTRMKKICQDMRVVALSATVPNIQDVASWIKLDSRDPQSAITLVFGEEYRPVKLEKVICGYRQNSNDFVFDTVLNSKLVEVLNEHCKGKPVLVFCPTRNSTVSTAKYIAKNYHGHLDLSKSFASVKERDLSEVSTKGIAYHHAGLSMDDRSSIERNFISGSIKILCSTSTLAVGVNLPAYLVVIKGTRIWNSTLFEEYSELDILQMMGRAGRPQFETQGKAVLMTTQEMQRRYEQLVKGNEKLESRLHLNLPENLVSEVHLKTIASLEDALGWMKHTFFYSRYQANPTAYGEIPYCQGMDMNGRLMKYCEGKLRELSDFMLIKVINGAYESTPFGDSMTRHYVHFETMKLFIKSKPGQSVANILTTLAKASEFKNIRLKRTEKRLFRDINDSPILKYPFKSNDKKQAKIENSYEKISLVIQYELGGLEYPNDQDLIKLQQSFKQDKMLVFKHITRLVRCFIDVFVEKKDFVSLKNCLTLSSCLSGGCWEDSPMVLKQLDGVTLTHVRRLANQNINSFVQVAEQDASRVEYCLGLRPGVGVKIKNQIQSLPRFALKTKVLNVSKPRDGSGLCISVESTLDVVSEAKKWKGRAISVVVTSGISTGEVVDFKRSFISKVTGSTSFTFQFPIKFSNTKLETCIYCEGIAGLGIQEVLDLTEGLSSAQLNALVQQHTNDDDFETEDDLDSLLVKVSASKGTKRPISLDDNHAANTSRNVLENNSLQCKHTCKDKMKCRHLCCREGIAPSTAKRIRTTLPTQPELPEQTSTFTKKDTSGYELLKRLHDKTVVNKNQQLSKFRLPQEASANLFNPSEKSVIVKQKNDGDIYSDDDDDDSHYFDVLGMLKRSRSTVAKSLNPQRLPSDETVGKTTESIMELPPPTSQSLKETSVDLIYQDLENVNNLYQTQNEEKYEQHGEENPDVPQNTYHRKPEKSIIRASTYQREKDWAPHPTSTQKFQGFEKSSNYHERYHQDQKMDEILDNTLEEELEGLFGSDVEIV